MGRRGRFKDLVLGVLKDKASLTKGALLSRPNTTSLHLAIVRATTHQASSLPHENHIKVVLGFGDSSRKIASICIEALMNRLHKTHNSSVAFKCLITIHAIIRRGSFILQDQLSIYPATGGRNYLNLSQFRHNSTSDTWNLSSWVRWYAAVLESLMLTFRILGYFFSQKIDQRQSPSALLTTDLLNEIDVLVSLIEEVCSAPESISNKNIVHEALLLVGRDCSSAQNELFIRINEVRTRMDGLKFDSLIGLVCVLKRLENCKERMLSLFLDRKGSVGDRLWCLVKEIKEKIGEGREYGKAKTGDNWETSRAMGLKNSRR